MSNNTSDNGKLKLPQTRICTPSSALWFSHDARITPSPAEPNLTHICDSDFNISYRMGSIRKQMESLWKETFGDSSDYVRLIFDNYFNPDLVGIHEENGTIKAALLGIPYSFKAGSGSVLSGLYLCGLATRKEARQMGIMSGIIEETAAKAAKEGFDFLFLIPSDSAMRKYYEERKFHDAFFKIDEHYVKGHDFKGSEEVTVEEWNGEDSGKLAECLLKLEEPAPGRDSAFQLMHTLEDWKAVLDEARISNSPLYTAGKNGNIEGVAFADRQERELRIKKILTSSEEVYRSLLAGVSAANQDYSLTLVKDLEEVLTEGSTQLWSPFYAQTNGRKAEYEDIAEVELPYNPSRSAYPFGMVRLLDFDSLLHKVGISNRDAFKGYTPGERENLLLRRPAGHQADALEKILDLPELSLSMSLMLE